MSDRLKPVIHKGVERKPTIGVCRIEECGFEWVMAYTPMDLMVWCGIAKRAYCPMCGDKKPLVRGSKEEELTVTISA